VRRLHLVATGGTIDSALRDGYLGVDSDRPPAILEFLPHGAECTWSRPFSILSEDATSTHWSILARHIAGLPLAELDAVLVSHGSDTLAWTSSALAYLLSGIPVPVVLFGSDKPLSDPSSNGPDNFRSAITFALAERLPGHFVSWRDPNGTSTIHLATRLSPADPHQDRFRSPLGVPFGQVAADRFSRLAHPANPSRSAISERATAHAWAESLKTLQLDPLFEDRVLVLPDQPGMDHSALLETIDRWTAVIQVAHHSGTASGAGGSGSFLQLAKDAREAGVPVFLGPTKRTLAYTSREPLLEAGVRLSPHQSLPSLVVKIRHLTGIGRLDRLEEDLAWELL
jgi:L-asparaginase